MSRVRCLHWPSLTVVSGFQLFKNFWLVICGNPSEVLGQHGLFYWTKLILLPVRSLTVKGQQESTCHIVQCFSEMLCQRSSLQPVQILQQCRYSSWTCLGVTAGPLVLHSHLNGTSSKGLNLSVHFRLSLDCYYLINFDSIVSHTHRSSFV